MLGKDIQPGVEYAVTGQRDYTYAENPKAMRMCLAERPKSMSDSEWKGYTQRHRYMVPCDDPGAVPKWVPFHHVRSTWEAHEAFVHQHLAMQKELQRRAEEVLDSKDGRVRLMEYIEGAGPLVPQHLYPKLSPNLQQHLAQAYHLRALRESIEVQIRLFAAQLGLSPQAEGWAPSKTCPAWLALQARNVAGVEE